jgi:protoporphyrinogen oxidase
MRKSCGMSATESIWAPLLKGKFAENDKNISMAWLWARLHVRSNSRESSSGEKLGYINGGFVKIVDAIEKELLAAGVSILRNSPVMALNGDQRMPQIKTRDSTIAYDAVLFTGSNNAMARILPEDSHLDSYRTDLAAIRYLGAMCHIFTSNQSLGNHYWINVNESKSPFLVFIEHTNLIPCSRYNGKHVYYIGAYLPQDSDNFTKPESQIIQQWYEYLGTMYPHFDPNLIDESHFFRFKDAQHIVDQGYESKILPYETPIPGVFLANFTQIFPEDRGTNFAVREGRRVAQAILNRLNSQGNESRCLH